MTCPPRWLALFLGLGFASSVAAQDTLSARIDKGIRAGKADFAKIASPLADDAEFLRRVYLDLQGVIPSAEEARAFLNDKARDKRVRLVERLLDSPQFALRMQNVFDVLLMDRRPQKQVPIPLWQEYLRGAFAANKPYDELVTEILAADGADPKKRGPARFYLDRDGEPHQITRDVSRLFLGMNLQCAQCHDHPLVDPYKQDHYYGIFAFYNRSFLFTNKGTKTSIYAEKAEGDVSFQNVFMPKITRNAAPRLPDGKLLDEPKFAKGAEYVTAPKKDERPEPKFSRRAQVAKLMVENPRFPRAAANRLWSLFLGRGMVHPVDFDHSDNPPSHPDLLKMLASEFAASKYDVKSLVRAIVLSDTYQRSSLLPLTGESPGPESFAMAALRPLSPEQLAWSMMQATGLTDAERKALGAKATPETVRAKLIGNEAIFVKLFGGAAGEVIDPYAFESTLDQTLFINNGDLIRGWLAPRPGNLMSRLLEAKDSAILADELYLSILTRKATAEEKGEVADFLKRRADRPTALQDLCWALLASAEFRFNH